MANPEHVAKVKAFYEWLGANAPLDLNMADLTAANLKGAYLERADLTGAKLRWAHLTSANLSRTTLINADLYAADLRGVNLADADLIGVILHEATYDNYTQWPDGFDPVKAGCVKVSPPNRQRHSDS